MGVRIRAEAEANPIVRVSMMVMRGEGEKVIGECVLGAVAKTEMKTGVGMGMAKDVERRTTVCGAAQTAMGVGVSVCVDVGMDASVEHIVVALRKERRGIVWLSAVGLVVVRVDGWMGG